MAKPKTKNAQKVERPLKSHVRAVLLYREIKKIQKEWMDQLKKSGVFDKLESKLGMLFKKEKLDERTAEIIEMFMGKERPMTGDEQISLAVEKAFQKSKDYKENTDSHHIPLILTSNGDLYREPKEKYCYPMKGEGMRLKLLRELMDHSTYRSPKDLANDISSKSKKSVTEAKRMINEKARTLLNLPEGKTNDLIISKNGYMMNPLYPITKER